MSEPKRELAMVAIVGLLATLATSSPGGWTYPNDGPHVKRLAPTLPVPPQEANVSAYPMVRLIPGRRSYLEPSGQGRGAIAYRDAFAVEAHIITAPADNELAETWAFRLREDIVAKLLANQSLDGLAQTIEFGGRERLEDLDYIAPKAWLMLPFTVWLKATEYQTTV